MTALAQRQQLVRWIAAAVQAGARLALACGEADISLRSHQRWTHGASVACAVRTKWLWHAMNAMEGRHVWIAQ